MRSIPKIISLALAVLLVLPLLLMSGTSNAMKKPGRIEVRFTLGTSAFVGELVNGNVLSQEEIDKIINSVMNQMNITCGVLEYSTMVIEQAKHLKGFDPAAALRIGLNIAGFGTFNDIYDLSSAH